MKINVLTLFPEMFAAVTESSILGKAVEKKLLEIRFTDIREYSLNKHKKTDEYPFGGGSGMVMTCEPVFRAMHAIGAEDKKVIYMSPRGRKLDKSKIIELAEEAEFVIVCGHYEGIDQRALEYWNMEEISIGDYILTGGEIPAMVLIDSVSRFIPGVLGDASCAEEESIYSGLLEYDQYTKPREYEGMTVPEVLFGGNHKEIALWKLDNQLALTKKRRPDLFSRYARRVSDALAENPKSYSKDEIKVLEKYLKTAK